MAGLPRPFYGFDHVGLAGNHVYEAHVGQHYANWMEEQGFDDWRDCFRPPTGNTEAQYGRWNIPEEYHYNTWMAERTNARLERHAENEDPFFTWASFFDPHPPYLVPEPWDEMYDPEDVTVPSVTLGENENNRQEETTVHLMTYVNDRYKLTVYYERDYGELFDLQEDPEEVHNRWDDPEYQNVKNELIRELPFAEMDKEPVWMPRAAIA